MGRNVRVEVEIHNGDNHFTVEQADFVRRSIEFYEHQRKRNRDNAKKRYKPKGIVGRPKRIYPVEISEEKSD